MPDYPSRVALAEGFADTIARHLAEAVASNGAAVLAVSGGSTPKRLFNELSTRALDWSAVSVVPVDERWVPEDSERSNARLIAENLLAHEARAAGFVSLHHPTAEPETGIDHVRLAVEALPQPFDVVVLGMGTDGHTASFFPGGDNLARALRRDTPEIVVPMRAPGAGEPRITLTLPVLLEARHLYLHVEGEEKRTVLEAAEAGDDTAEMPVRAVLGAAQLEVVWAP